MPKSSTLRCPSLRMKRLSGLMSRWMMPWACAAASTSSSSSTSAERGELDALGAARSRGERVALEQLHHEEGRPVLGHVDVPHLDRAGVLEAVDRVRLLLEPGAEMRVARHAGVEDFDGLLPADLVGRDVHRRHAAGAEEAIQRPLVAQRRPDASGCFLLLGLHPRLYTRVSGPGGGGQGAGTSWRAETVLTPLVPRKTTRSTMGLRPAKPGPAPSAGMGRRVC